MSISKSTGAAKAEWTVTQVALDRLLIWLDADQERAAEKYEHIRRCLIKIFTTRGYAEADELADKTIDRVAKLNVEQDLAATYVGSPLAYFAHVAGYIRHEHDRRTSIRQQCPHLAAPVDVEHQHRCLEACLARLAAEDSQLVLAYYQDDKQAKIKTRRELAARFGVSSTALRIRVHRLRVGLQACVEECLTRYNEAS